MDIYLINLVDITTVDATTVQTSIWQLAQRLRSAFPHWCVEMSLHTTSLKKQLKKADQRRAKYVLIIGKQEATSGQVTLKNMHTGMQQTIPASQAEQAIDSDARQNRKASTEDGVDDGA